VIVAIVPVGAIDGAKSRLGAVLDAEERRDLAFGLAERTIRAAVLTPGIDETLVVTPDDEIRDLATRAGAPMRCCSHPRTSSTSASAATAGTPTSRPPARPERGSSCWAGR
jgi:2-phospho-L-lactate guanylyltransferase (CobY/MobA/RfbA family)